ncbi:N-acetylated-alpha-linked acidic dipeptidase 2 [Cherax quadricarinatus]
MVEGRAAVAASAGIFLLLLAVFVTLIVVSLETGSVNPEDVILQQASKDAITATLRYLTSEPHTAATEVDTQQAQWVAEQWQEQGLDQVHLLPYTVLLSYPDRNKTNEVIIADGSGETVWKSEGRQPPLWPGEDDPRVLPSFNAYSAPGSIQGNVVFAFLGRDEDFQYLESINISVTGAIVLIRYGAIYRSNKVHNAEVRGAGGVLLYLDPASVSPLGQNSNVTYPSTKFAPPHAVQFGNTQLGNGDPLTPFYPSIESAFRIPEEEVDTPRIPVQPISYSDAYYIFSQLGGEEAPDEWQGGLNLTYRLGPGLHNHTWTTTLTVYTHAANATIYNVIGTITGSVEPDRYVVLGNHRDAWIFGGVDPSSATAALLEVSRLFGQLTRDGWRPRRTLVFCSWGAEEYGLIGSTEWTEQFTTHLKSRAIAYLNVDMVFDGTYSFISMASPLLYDVVITETQKVPNPDPEEVAAGRPTLYDTWLFRHPDPQHPGRPRFLGINDGSDFSSFQHILGIPCMDMYYTAADDESSLPLYHTLYETFHLAAEIYDPQMNYHLALTQSWALIALSLAQKTLIPFSVESYGEFLKDALIPIDENYGYLLNQTSTQYGTLPHSALAVRAANDAMMMLDRAFLDPRGLPGRPHYNHVVTAPSMVNSYTTDTFAGLQDLLYDLESLTPEEQVLRWRQVKEHLAAVTHFTLAAANILSYELW